MGVRRGIIVIAGVLVALSCARVAMIRPTGSSTTLRQSVPGIPGTLAFETDQGACPTDATMIDSDQPSPDAAWLARRATHEERARYQADGLVLTEPATGRREFIRTPSPYMLMTRAMAWSPDSARIAYLASFPSAPDSGTVYVARLDTLSATAVVTYTGLHRAVAWSPDSTTLAYTSAEISGYTGNMTGYKPARVWIVPADASRQPTALAEGCWPRWTAE